MRTTEPISVGSLYLEICQQEAAKHSNRSPLWISNNDVHDDAFDGVRLNNVPHGMNNLQDHEVCCIMWRSIRRQRTATSSWRCVASTSASFAAPS